MRALPPRARWGVALALAYVAVAFWTTGSPSRPLFDIGPPLQYRWVNPPASFAGTNQKPESGSHVLPLTATGIDAASVSTNDGQAAVVLKQGSIAPHQGDKLVSITIVPLDPAPLGPPPVGMRYDGNAYRFTATYKPSGAEATLKQPGTVVLQFPIVATTLLRRDGTIWTDLKASPVSVSLQIFATSDKLGVFVAAGPPLNVAPVSTKGFPAAIVISAGAAVAAVVAGLFARTRAKRRRRGGATKGAAGKRGSSGRSPKR